MGYLKMVTNSNTQICHRNWFHCCLLVVWLVVVSGNHTTSIPVWVPCFWSWYKECWGGKTGTCPAWSHPSSPLVFWDSWCTGIDETVAVHPSTAAPAPGIAWTSCQHVCDQNVQAVKRYREQLSFPPPNYSAKQLSVGCSATVKL